MHKVIVMFSGLSVMALPLSALAVQTPEQLEDHAYGQHRVDGVELRVQPNVGWQAPVSARTAWQNFAQANPKWHALWDLDRALPSRMYGAGIKVPGSSLSAETGEAAARSFFAAHSELLHPGISAEQLVLVANDFDAQSNMRTVAFEQTVAGMVVRGTGVSVRIKNDNVFVAGSKLHPNLEARAPKSRLSAQRALGAAKSFIGKKFSPAEMRTESFDAQPFVWSWISEDGRLGADVVAEAIVWTEQPMAKWSVLLDARSGQVLGYEQLLKFAAGSITLNTPNRYPANGYIETPAHNMEITVDGTAGTTDGLGNFTFPNATAAVGGTVRGTDVIVINDRGARITFDTTMNDGDTYVFDGSGAEFSDAQVNAFAEGYAAREYVRAFAPNTRWLDRPLQATVNIADTCNAFSDGNTINFFSAGNRCDNTGRLADVVHHEFGHSFHANVIIRGVGDFDGALSEGASDYLAATISDDSAMGRGFFYQNQPLRQIDPANSEAVWPDDVARDTHTTGLIIGGAFWDLRKAMVAQASDPATAVRMVDTWWYQALRRASDIPTTYVEVLAADDDDGDISNGTPNICTIQEAFALHGLADADQVSAPIGLPQLDVFTISLPVGEAPSACPGAQVTGAELFWQNRADLNQNGTVAMATIATGYEGAIPPPESGTVIQYQVRVTLDDGSVRTLPDNAADPLYELFVGEVVELYCTDFESDPDLEGFSHELLGGEMRDGADDWQWGAPAGVAGSGDPDMAYSGVNVYGNDLGEGNFNGTYQSEKTNVLHAPSVAVGDFTNVRLQYRRWLNIEDADFDQGRIASNGQFVWTNYATGGGGDTHHEDKEWRFQDVDLSATVQNGEVQVDFLMQSDRGLNFGGWTIDDFCIVGYEEPVVAAECGNGMLEAGETCDDGNLVDGDGCESSCTPTPVIPAACGDGRIDAGEACDDGNAANGDGCEANCTLTPEVDPCVQDPASCMEPMNPMNPQLPGNLNEDQGGCGCSSHERGLPQGNLLGFAALLGFVLLRRRRR